MPTRRRLPLVFIATRGMIHVPRVSPIWPPISVREAPPARALAAAARNAS